MNLKDIDQILAQGAAALDLVRKRLLRGKPADCAQVLDNQWQMLTRLSWGVAARVPREQYVYSAIGRRAMEQLRGALFARAAGIEHADRWMERHQDWLASVGTEMAQYVDVALNFPGCMVIREVELDRRGRVVIYERAMRDPDPAAPPPSSPRRKRRALVPDERVTERQLDAIAATLTPSEMAFPQRS